MPQLGVEFKEISFDLHEHFLDFVAQTFRFPYILLSDLQVCHQVSYVLSAIIANTFLKRSVNLSTLFLFILACIADEHVLNLFLALEQGPRNWKAVQITCLLLHVHDFSALAHLVVLLLVHYKKNHTEQSFELKNIVAGLLIVNSHLDDMTNIQRGVEEDETMGFSFLWLIREFITVLVVHKNELLCDGKDFLGLHVLVFVVLVVADF